MSPIKKIKKFISYWYLRYLLATELYMVEPWERVVIHFVFAIMFSFFGWFNSALVCVCIDSLRNTSQMEPIS